MPLSLMTDVSCMNRAGSSRIVLRSSTWLRALRETYKLNHLQQPRPKKLSLQLLFFPLIAYLGRVGVTMRVACSSSTTSNGPSVTVLWVQATSRNTLFTSATKRATQWGTVFYTRSFPVPPLYQELATATRIYQPLTPHLPL